MLKFNAVQKCKETIRLNINLYKDRIEELRDSLAGNDAEDDDGSGELMADFETYNRLKDESQKNQDTFLNISFNNSKSIVREGAVVTTNKNIFLIRVSLGEFITDQGDTFYAISTEAPIYTAMKGLKEGDSFSFSEMTRTILKIY